MAKRLICAILLAMFSLGEMAAAQAVANTIRPGTCGQNYFPVRSLPPKHNRVVGGTEATKHSIPWIVSLRPSGMHWCGGTLVRVRPDKEESDIVVTAAHCMNVPKPFNVTAGAHYYSYKEVGEVSVQVEQVINHHWYNYPVAQANDITILKLSQPIKFNNHIQPACLPSQNEDPATGTQGLLAGWGDLYEGAGAGSDRLMQVYAPIVDSQTCKQQYEKVKKKIDTQAMLCGGYWQGGKDTCQGDSGGPYLFRGRNGYTLHGVVSWGEGCARAELPGVYARVSNYVDWIQEQIRGYSTVYRSR
jgi:transmembrane serine protease 3